MPLRSLLTITSKPFCRRWCSALLVGGALVSGSGIAAIGNDAIFRNDGRYSNGFHPVSATAPATGYRTPANDDPVGSVVIRHEHQPRVGTPGQADFDVVPQGAGIVAFDPAHYPDEYLIDGGDRGHPFHYEGYQLGGLETEDTIGDWRDARGKLRATASSRVTIYAPRFAAVRSVTGSTLNRNVDQLAGAHHDIRTAGYNTGLRIDQEIQRDRMQNVELRTRASGIDVQSGGSSLGKIDQPGLHQNLNAAYQNLAFLTDGEIRQGDLALLGYGVQMAALWTREQNPVIVAKDVRGHELKALAIGAEAIGTEERGVPGKLRILKLADRDVTKPGDVITFTLRFDNLGDHEISDVRIMDNLTPRLEYLAKSVEAELPGGLNVAPNGEGSSILTFHLNEPLRGRHGGTITFQCRVR